MRGVVVLVPILLLTAVLRCTGTRTQHRTESEHHRWVVLNISKSRCLPTVLPFVNSCHFTSRIPIRFGRVVALRVFS
ncbi:hypothetical protein B0I73DRAFT_765 [Yarrowia lipolytica]|uniref:Secreted protein n=1 Tax=Yarrowia lipolytica TaxID=4952 RepID=A0A371CE00_YARLL|nr:hypothetical protein B0I71DRAFT_40417 [Yarrowia lipolytica]RDW42732.1 hypothetical protein B0I73DRAFT_765 [Yarrowia lipolytica]RDW43703.1 hypothetical protein B0I74DRAFT_6728 [Yarrowia lipolytica]RDW55292.1 hypothetical protein B0I75DRAFT_40616 [Yarrowia lipolytica]